MFHVDRRSRSMLIIITVIINTRQTKALVIV